MKRYVVIEEISGKSKTSGNPYHMLKVADEVSYENHTLSVDSNFIVEPLGLQRGQRVTLALGLRTNFRGTEPTVEGVTVVK